MYVYALALKKEYDITASTASIIYITKIQTNRLGVVKIDGTRSKLADVPPKVGEVKIDIDESSLEFIEGLINLIAESVQLFIEKPEYRHIIMQDSRYKNNSTPIKYKIAKEEEIEV
jgi:hypothetical protein